ncbi:ABC transporter substrate-binding protein [Streptomyces armeniacus]|uniref:ABC transporter substrate-binding protein n=2 Tax=Streptomyces armeniacus TaxID=83291 RepID=A0A345XTP3_9ACTN|nr:ABC transporter substrate-binding protein [Streptomyces armeniacus]
MPKVIPALTALALLLTGCAGGEDSGAASTITVAVGEPDHLTPGRSTVGLEGIRALFAPLVKADEHGGLTYVQARSVESEDSKNWTIHLRSGWKFHNGEAVTAQSYADAWNKTAYGPNAWAANGQLANIEGYDALNPAKGKPKTDKLSGVKVVNETTLKVTLANPDSQFPLQLTSNQVGFYPLPKAAYEDPAAFDRKPAGNGPYKLDGEWEKNKGATASAYGDYQGQKPLTSHLDFRSYTDLATAYTDAYTDAQAGTVDVLQAPVNKYSQTKTDFAGRVYSYQAPSLEFISLPLYDERYQKPGLRKAISMAIDRDAVNNTMYGGLYEPATSLTPPAEVGAKTDVCDECTFDPKEARKELAAAGGWSGPMVITYPGGLGFDELYKAVANQIRQNLRIDNVTARPTADFAEFSEKAMAKKINGPYHGHWGALYPSMQNTLRSIFTKAGDCYACSYYSEPEVDSLLRRADASTVTEESEKLYNKAQERILEDFPVVPLFYGTYVYVTTERISNVVIGPADLELDRLRVIE